MTPGRKKSSALDWAHERRNPVYFFEDHFSRGSRHNRGRNGHPDCFLDVAPQAPVHLLVVPKTEKI